MVVDGARKEYGNSGVAPEGAAADFAILIPHFNQLDELEDAIASCGDARLANRAHLVVVDDASAADQDPAQLLEDYEARQNFKKVTLVRNSENIGVSKSLNRGLRVINEPVFFRLDADDRVFQQRFEMQLKALKDGFDLVFSEAEIIFEGEVIARSFSPSRKMIIDTLPIQCLLLHPTLAARTEFFESRGGYPEATRSGQDWAFWKKHLHEARFRILRTPLVKLCLSLSSVSNSKFERSPGSLRTLKLRTALRYADRENALKAARELGLLWYLGVLLAPNPYQIRLRIRLFRWSLKNRRTRVPPGRLDGV